MLALLAFALIGLPPADDLAPEHARNPVLAAILAEGLEAGGVSARLPAPAFPDGQDAGAQRAALRELAGSERAVEELLRDSVTAPFVLKLRDERGEDATIRAGDLYFVIRADLDAIDPRSVAVGDDSEPVEAANMRFEARALAADDLAGSAVEPPGEGEWLIHSAGRLLDRIAVETTNRLTASRSAGSLIVAGRADPRFGAEDRWPNRWATFDRRTSALGEAQPYAGGSGYAKITRLEGVPGALVVELHFAFAEPRAWFDGAPALRSKLSLAAQDAIRRLRRELAR